MPCAVERFAAWTLAGLRACTACLSGAGAHPPIGARMAAAGNGRAAAGGRDRARDRGRGRHGPLWRAAGAAGRLPCGRHRRRRGQGGAPARARRAARDRLPQRGAPLRSLARRPATSGGRGGAAADSRVHLLHARQCERAQRPARGVSPTRAALPAAPWHQSPRDARAPRAQDARAVLDAEFGGHLDVVYEGVGGALFRAALANLSPSGRLLSVGYISVRPRAAPPLRGGSGPRAAGRCCFSDTGCHRGQRLLPWQCADV